MKRTATFLTILFLAYAAVAVAQGGSGNPVVDIQKSPIDRVELYKAKLKSGCLQRYRDVAQFNNSQATGLIGCCQDYYRQTVLIWCESNNDLINAVAKMSASMSDQFVPPEPTCKEQRKEMAGLIASAHGRVVN